jgi:hypothetical protein
MVCLAKIDTARGSVQVDLGALGRTWDSSQAVSMVDMFGFGVGVSPAVSHVDVNGGMRVVTEDTNTRETVSVRTVNMNPFDRAGGHTFMGPNNEGPDVLFSRGGDYTYQTTLSDRDSPWDTDGTTVLSEWNTASSLVRRETTIPSAVGGKTTHSQAFLYPGTHNGITAPGELLPPNHTKPTTTTVTYTNAAG